jgi:hypothetical protein
MQKPANHTATNRPLRGALRMSPNTPATTMNSRNLRLQNTSRRFDSSSPRWCRLNGRYFPVAKPTGDAPAAIRTCAYELDVIGR